MEPQSALEKLALLASDDAGILRATVAGVLLCTRSPEQWLPNVGITATRYSGSDRASGQLDAQEITGPLNRQIGDAVAFAVRNMRVGARKDPARVNLPQYSEKALFEAIVNAAAHRDYSIRGSRIRLSMFEDRLEVQSPGSLPNNLTLESMEARQATRNEVLTSVLARMPVDGVRGSTARQYFMERRGDGVPIILRETRELSGRRPEYRLVDNSEVLLIIPAAKTDQTPARTVITVQADGRPLRGSDVLTLFPDKTWKRTTTGENGEAEVDLHTTHLPMTVFVAAPGHRAHLEREWIPSRGPLAVEVGPTPGGWECHLCRIGRLPSCGQRQVESDSETPTKGRISTHPTLLLTRGKRQPVHFALGQEMRLTDADGREATVRVIEVVGRSALLEYRPCDAGREQTGAGTLTVDELIQLLAKRPPRSEGDGAGL